MNRLIGLMVLSAATFLGGCKKGADVQAWFEQAGTLRQEALQQAQNTPYRLEQHQALKAYFAQLGGMALSLKDDDKLRKRFNKAFGRANPAEICASALMERREWSAISRNCRKNEFFLCAEEVRAYPEMVSALREGLTEEQRKRFDSAPECREALAQ